MKTKFDRNTLYDWLEYSIRRSYEGEHLDEVLISPSAEQLLARYADEHQTWWSDQFAGQKPPFEAIFGLKVARWDVCSDLPLMAISTEGRVRSARQLYAESDVLQWGTPSQACGRGNKA